MNNQRIVQRYITLIFFVMFIYGISFQAVGTLITRIISHYGISMAQAGLLSSFTSAGNFAAILVIAVLSGRIHKMILMGLSMFFYTVSMYLISVAPPFGIILGCFALIGIFGATADTMSNSLVADFTPKNISRSISLLHGLFGLGGLCGPILIERLTVNTSWAQTYFVISMVLLGYMIVYAAYVKWQWNNLLAHMSSHEKQTRFGLADMARFFTKKRHVLLWITMFFYGGIQSTLVVWIKRYVETHLNEPAWGAYVLSAVWLGTVISRMLISPGIKASSPVKICAGNAISAVALAAGLLSGSARGIAAATLLVGLSSGLSVPLIIAMGCEWHKENTAFGTLMPFTAHFIAYVVFPPFIGLVGDYFGIPWGIAVGAASALIAAAFAAMLEQLTRKPLEA
jgi:fucose permease